MTATELTLHTHKHTKKKYIEDVKVWNIYSIQLAKQTLEDGKTQWNKPFLLWIFGQSQSIKALEGVFWIWI